MLIQQMVWSTQVKLPFCAYFIFILGGEVSNTFKHFLISIFFTSLEENEMYI